MFLCYTSYLHLFSTGLLISSIAQFKGIYFPQGVKNFLDVYHNFRIFFSSLPLCLHPSCLPSLVCRISTFTNSLVAVVTVYGRQVWVFLSPNQKIHYGVSFDVDKKTKTKNNF